MPTGVLISSSLPNLVNGVSQQPFTLRLASQAELQENHLSTVSDGLLRRPGSTNIKKLTSTQITNAFCHTINRDDVEQYQVIITNGAIAVYDMAGNAKTVNAPNGLTYLNDADPKNTFTAVTVADYTFIANKKKVVAASGTNWPTRNPEAVIAVRAGNYGKKYSITRNGTLVGDLQTPDGSVASNSPFVDTGVIANALATGTGWTTANGATNAQNLTGNSIAFTRVQNLIYLTNAVDFTIACADGANGNAMDVTKGTIQKFSDLPKGGVVADFTVKVIGDQASNQDDYYVKWVPGGSGSTNGTWTETVAPGTSKGLDPATMPYVLVRESDGTFTFKQGTWDFRLVGDATTNPDPSFVGQTISDIFFHRNRLGFESSDSVVMSQASGYFNFYRTTMQSLLDSDPIDVNASHTKVANLFAGVPFNKKLVLFSNLTQFVLDGNDLLTSKSVSIKPATEFEADSKMKPAAMGKNIYFGVPRGNWSGIREFYTDDTTSVENSEEITGHVQHYVPGGLQKVAIASNENTQAYLTANTNELYVWRTYWSNNERLQNSWSKWTFPSSDKILGIDFIKSKLYMVISRTSGTYMEVIDIALGSLASNELYDSKLDRKFLIASGSLTYSGGVTSFTPPFPCDDGSYVAIIDNNVANTEKAATSYPLTWNSGTGKLEIKGNHLGNNLVVGRKYKSRYILSTITYKQAVSNGSQKSDTEGRLQIRRIGINHSSTGYYQVIVTPKGRDSYTYTFAGKYLGDETVTLGAISLADGKFYVPIQCRNTDVTIELVTDEPLPAAYLSIDWEGLYVKRSKGV